MTPTTVNTHPINETIENVFSPLIKREICSPKSSIAIGGQINEIANII